MTRTLHGELSSVARLLQCGCMTSPLGPGKMKPVCRGGQWLPPSPPSLAASTHMDCHLPHVLRVYRLQVWR